ncbi:MAG: hydroxymethylglutaryl-CoA lyase [Ectothiorhodospiraceae bacterium]|nr:hydroxymethylglutaryl-CoA lyase [Ectothiorhodospiraceae bacterium]
MTSDKYPAFVDIIEVGPRDGLQSETKILTTTQKIILIHDLSDCGYREIEVSSFVKPSLVPQLADAEAVFNGLDFSKNSIYSALVANQRGFERALDCGVHHIALLTTPSESFCQRNIHCSVAESLERIKSINDQAIINGMTVKVYISCVFNCPYEKVISTSQVSILIESLMDIGCHELSLADTTGRATPGEVVNRITEYIQIFPLDHISLHFHDTYGQALANVLACLQVGLHRFDTSVAGIGGCNFSPGASGNLATEDLLFMLQGMGIHTNIDLEKVSVVGDSLSKLLGHANGSRVGHQLTDNRYLQ